MIAIHWSPVNNTKKILKDGIKKSKNGVYCFPLTGHRIVDTWWVKAFNQFNFRINRKKYNGFIFRIEQEYLPAYFGHWIGATTIDKFEKNIQTLDELKKEFKEKILFRTGENLRAHPIEVGLSENDFIKIAEGEINKDKIILNRVLNNQDLMTYIFEDIQIVLEHSIPASKIIKVISSQDEFGKVIYKAKKNKIRSKKEE